MKFTLKHYKKAARIWLKPSEDISADPARCVHFSIAWFQDPRNEEFTKEEQRKCTAELYAKLRAYLEQHGAQARVSRRRGICQLHLWPL